jgi:uncharacterized protein (TIGR02246 family)
MRRFTFCLMSGICALLGFAAMPPVHAQSKDEQEIRALEGRFVAAFNARDVDAIMKLYVPGSELVVFDLGLPLQHLGWDDYKNDWQGVFAGMKGPVNFSITGLSIESDGKMAFSHSIQHVTLTGPDGNPMEMTVRVTDVYRKIDGKWLIVHEHVSVPIDFSGPKPEPAMTAKP